MRDSFKCASVCGNEPFAPDPIVLIIIGSDEETFRILLECKARAAKFVEVEVLVVADHYSVHIGEAVGVSELGEDGIRHLKVVVFRAPDDLKTVAPQLVYKALLSDDVYSSSLSVVNAKEFGCAKPGRKTVVNSDSVKAQLF
jgi:hypothetical protein